MSDELWTTVWTSASVAAAISVTGSLVTLWVAGRRDRHDRQRQTFARALAAAVDYREFPYVVRRRRADREADERARISGELRALQQKLNYYTAWIDVESPEVAVAYRQLVSETRRIFGPLIRDAWLRRPSGSDDAMNTDGIDVAALLMAEGAYVSAVRRHLSWWSLQRGGSTSDTSA